MALASNLSKLPGLYDDNTLRFLSSKNCALCSVSHREEKGKLSFADSIIPNSVSDTCLDIADIMQPGSVTAHVRECVENKFAARTVVLQLLINPDGSP